MADGDGSLAVLSDELLGRVLALLGPAQLLVVETVSRRFQRVARSECSVRITRFHFTHPPELIANFMGGIRAACITELDVNNCIQLESIALKTCLKECVNLTTLLCLNTRLLPVVLFLQSCYSLRNLRRLDWSLTGSTFRRQHISNLLSLVRACNSSIGLASLQYMYVEVTSNVANANFLRCVLRMCPALVSLHLHERNAYKPACRLARDVFRTYAKHAKWDIFTYTTDRVPDTHHMKAWAHEQSPFREGELVDSLEKEIRRYGNVSVLNKPHRVRSCVKLVDHFAKVRTEGLEQLIVNVKDLQSTPELLNMPARNDTLHHLRALTVLGSDHPSMSRSSRATLYEAPFSAFLAVCEHLQELNLASFHFEKHFDCCQVLSKAGLSSLRWLSLPSCALRRPAGLEHLASASFRLRSLDIRGNTSGTSRICKVCDRRSTCNTKCLSPLSLLCPLERLTLCDLPQVGSLSFLVGCSVSELRLRNLGFWSMRNRPNLAPLTALCGQLRSLKLESRFLPSDLSFLRDLQPAPKLRRLCVATFTVPPKQRSGLFDFLRGLFPLAHTLHVHALMHPSDYGLFWRNVPGARNEPYRYGVFPNDKLELCDTCDYTGLAKPFR